jgi:AAA+ ATPase superfamily predicted ATPase
MPFYGRRQELAALAEELRRAGASGSGRLVAVRGRRQVGKSRLLERFAAQSDAPYGVIAGMKRTPVEVQMRRAVETLSSATRPLPALDAVTAVTPADWYDLLSRMRLALDERPAILVIDEFPWAEETNRGLDGLLQSLWDQELRRHPVLVVLVGSDEAMMQRLFEHDRPLFGRLDANLVVEPFTPAETARALGRSREALEAFDMQLVTGGFPELVAHARRFHSVAKLVEEALARPHSLLADVAQINLAGELSDHAGARAVLEAIGSDEIGVVSFSRIASAMGGGSAAETAVSRAADALVARKRIVAIDLPAGSRSGRLKRYRIADSYLRFWFRFIEPHLRNIEVGRGDLALRSFHGSWAAWRGKAIEPIVREAVLRLAPRLPAPYDSIESVGGWWDRTGSHEYDLLGLSGAGAPVAVGSIKWRERSLFGARDLAELANARAVIPQAGAAGLLAIAPRGAQSNVRADVVLDADDLLAAWQA